MVNLSEEIRLETNTIMRKILEKCSDFRMGALSIFNKRERLTFSLLALLGWQQNRATRGKR